MVNVLELTLQSRLESVEEAAAKTAQFAQARHLDAEMTNALDMSVRESVANAVKHGNRFDEGKQIELTVIDGDDAVEVTVRDFGAGFDVDSVPDPTNPENLMKTCGRGILFMRAFMDEVGWSCAQDGGMIAKMRKAKK